MFLDALTGAAAGAAATGPMTGTMKLGSKLLPIHQKYSLPPRQITSRVSRWAGVWGHLDRNERWMATWAAHYAYGAAAGAIYSLLTRGRRQNALTGMGFGLLVWGGSYLGLLPSLNIMQPASRHPKERNLLMIVAHLVWGASLAGGLKAISSSAQLESSP
jgi:hypothetical protein